MPTTMTHTDRDRIRSLVPAGDTDAIQTALTAGDFKRKLYKVAEVDEASSEIVFTVSSDTVDRDSERVLPKSIEKDFAYYKENPVVLFHHDHSIPAVAKMVEHKITNKEVIMRDRFAVDVDYPLAKVLWELYSKGYMRMTSIGFIPLEWTEDEDMLLEGQKGYTFTRIEMIEHSLVNVGSNRHAVSELPAKIRNDALLKGAYESMVETKSTPLTEKLQEIVGATETLHIPTHAEGLPLNITFQLPEGKEALENMATQLPKEHQCPSCKAKADAVGAIETKGANLAAELNTIIDGGDHDRDETIQKMADECGMETDGIDAILDGATQCPSKEVIEGLARGCGITADKLFDAAMQDGCEYDGMDTEEDMSGDDMDDDKAFEASDKAVFETKAKFYGMLTGMFPESYEERQRAIHEDLIAFLEHEIDAIDKYEYVEAYPIATFPDHVIVYCWNTDTIYKALYAMEAGEVEFTELKQIQLNYEEMPMDAKVLSTEMGENVIDENTIGETDASDDASDIDD